MSFLSMTEAEILIHAFISSRLYYCNALFSSLLHESTYSLYSDLLCFTRNYLVWPALFQVTKVQEVMLLRHHLAMPHTAQSSPGSTHFTYIINCIRYSVSVTCKLWFCCSVLYMQRLLHVCLSWERDPPLWLFLRFFPFSFCSPH